MYPDGDDDVGRAHHLVGEGLWELAHKGLVYWALSSLMVAEERITTKFAGLVKRA